MHIRQTYVMIFLLRQVASCLKDKNQSAWHTSHLVLAVVLTMGSFLGIR